MSKRASIQVKITNKLGLHARPAMAFVDLAGSCKSKVTVRRTDGGDEVDGKSIMQMMMLAATQGTELEIIAEGDDASDALAKLEKLVKSKFGED